MNKQGTLIAIGMMVMLSVTSCQKKTSLLNLKTEIDTLSYAIGISNSLIFASYIEDAKVDSADMDAFMKGFRETALADINDKKQLAYFAGQQVGKEYGVQAYNSSNRSFLDSSMILNKENFVAGLISGVQEDYVIYSSIYEAFCLAQVKLEEINTKVLEKEFAANKEANIRFLEENKMKEGVVTLPSGLQYKVIADGRGAKPTLSDRVSIDYEGSLIDGTLFKSGKRERFEIENVIGGWQEALTMMPVGSTWMLYIPEELGYSIYGDEMVDPFSTLIYKITLLAIQ